jgi:transcriptional regulator with XRE-family HTH domain
MRNPVQEDLAQLGAQLRHARTEAGLTQAAVGRRAGVSRQLVNRIEGGYNGEIAAYIAVANALDYRLRLIEEVPLNDGEQAARDLIAQLRTYGVRGG